MSDTKKLKTIEKAFVSDDLEELSLMETLNKMADALGRDRKEFAQTYRNIREGVA